MHEFIWQIRVIILYGIINDLLVQQPIIGFFNYIDRMQIEARNVKVQWLEYSIYMKYEKSSK